MEKQDVQAALEKAQLSQLTAHADQLIRPSIRLQITPQDEAKIAVGAAKFGGAPDLPPGTTWPQWKNVPQSFIAQIRLDEIQPYDSQKVLPSTGMLWFFYDAQQETYGDDPQNRGGWQIMYSDKLTNLQRASFPEQLPASSRFPSCSIRYNSENTLAQQPQLEIPGLQWKDEDQEKYDKVYEDFTQKERGQAHHRMLGFPETLQDDMRAQCQLISHGVTDENDKRAQELEKGVNDWLLLLQVDSDDHAGMKWSNTGMLYFWITRQDLQARHFDGSWLVLQSE